jgi:methylmalonyl-CoA mutase
MEADGRPYHDGGATEAQELGFVLATALVYFRTLEGKIADRDLARAVGIALTVDCDFFLGIAKLRAMRLLWRNLLEACSIPWQPLALHVESSWRMMTAREANLNLLRAVAAAFAAAIGGADSVTILPHSLVHGLPDGFARRMARNIQIMLMEEAHLHRVADPGSGSGYIEALTHALASRAWSMFQDVERLGGMAAALASGHVRDLLGDAARKRNQAVSSRRRPIVGVSEFRDPADVPPTVLEATRLELPRHDATAIRAQRLSEPWEPAAPAASPDAGII